MTIDFSIFDKNERPIDLDAKIVDSLGYEPAAVARFFAGKKWQEITIDGLRNQYEHDFSACPVFMTPKAYAYYLPAFMKVIIFDPYEADVLIDAVIGQFRSMAEGQMVDYFQEIERTWSREQMRFAGEFLRITYERYEKGQLKNELDGDSKKAYDLLWGKY